MKSGSRARSPRELRPCSRLAEGFAAPDPDRSMAGIRRHPGSQMGFLTADWLREDDLAKVDRDHQHVRDGPAIGGRGVHPETR